MSLDGKSGRNLAEPAGASEHTVTTQPTVESNKVSTKSDIGDYVANLLSLDYTELITALEKDIGPRQSAEEIRCLIGRILTNLNMKSALIAAHNTRRSHTSASHISTSNIAVLRTVLHEVLKNLKTPSDNKWS